MRSKEIFNFKKAPNTQDWTIVDDIVMGGKSNGNFGLNSKGFGVFEGKISLDNKGGFSSVRYRFNKIAIGENKKLKMKLKGDGKKYQVRIKPNVEDSYSYIAYFETIGEWQEIEIPLNQMYPCFRGRKLDDPNFSHNYIEEISFLYGNKKEEKFELILEKIELI